MVISLSEGEFKEILQRNPKLKGVRVKSLAINRINKKRERFNLQLIEIDLFFYFYL